MTSFTNIRQKAISLIELLPPEKLTAIVQLLEFLTEPSQETIPSQELVYFRLSSRVCPSKHKTGWQICAIGASGANSLKQSIKN